MILQKGTHPNVLPMLLCICVSFWLLAHEPRDLSQAETRITLVKS